jgi:DNA ligase (NAD+)
VTPFDAAAQILRRRKQCLVHRYLYYVLNTPLIDDQQYDAFERELRTLVEQFPHIAELVKYADDCPTKTVGSSMIGDYPRDLQMVAESLHVYNMENLEWWMKVTSPDAFSILDDVMACNLNKGSMEQSLF